MKRLIIIVILICFGIDVSQAQEWGRVHTLTGEWLRKICTQGVDTVYIAGENGLIAQSTDQGETWNKQHFSTGAALNDIIFIDHYNGFAVGEQGTILKTGDAGANWAQVILNVTSSINAIAATGLDNIWAVGDNSLVLHSIDGGDNWQQVNILPENENNRQLLDIEFRDNLGYFTGNYATVYKTEDYGVAWTKQNIGDASYDTDFYSINIMENKTYLMYNSDSYYNPFQYLFSTENQIDWNQTRLDWLYRREVPFFVNDNTGYIASSLWPVGAASYGVFAVWKTENGGTQWSYIEMRDHLYIEQEESLGKSEKITVVNDTLGYAIVGQVLCKTPAPASPPPDGIEKFENRNVLKISRTGQKKLLIQSESKPVLSIEVFDIAGNKLAHNQWINPAKEITVQMDSYATGVYVIKAIHCDNTLSINKINI